MITSNFTIEDYIRYFSKINFTDDPDQCWLWIAGKSSGYGMFWVKSEGKNIHSHRIAYEIAYGETPADLFVLHKCDNPPCVNPHHLFLGTSIDNAIDREKKGRGIHPMGEDHSSSMLTLDKVREIRKRYSQGGVYHRELAEEFGVKRQTIGDIINKRRWKHAK